MYVCVFDIHKYNLNVNVLCVCYHVCSMCVVVLCMCLVCMCVVYVFDVRVSVWCGWMFNVYVWCEENYVYCVYDRVVCMIGLCYMSLTCVCVCLLYGC